MVLVYVISVILMEYTISYRKIYLLKKKLAYSLLFLMDQILDSCLLQF